MASSFVICDKEEGYASALAAFLMQKKELAFQIQVVTSPEQAEEFLEEKPVDILVIHEGWPREERKKFRAGSVFVLTESDRGEAGPGETALYRYQSADALLAQMVQNSGPGLRTAGELFLQKRRQDVRVIGIFSPVHRTGKTRYALKLGQEIGSASHTLYLNLELYGGIGGYFPEEGNTLADALYYSRMEGRDLGWMLASMVSHMGPLDYLLPARVSEDLKAVPGKDFQRLISQIVTEGMYEVVILDLDEGIRDVYELLRMCTEIHMPVPSDRIAEAKIFQFEEELHLLGYDDVKQKIRKKEKLR
ncbi:hypothetical protein [Mordavella massiliensis]|uniref:Uncharacterized protein n=1 Tax=Mordavella massiliensis TaxID=1871024 RepID=A0A939BAY4_9CLOT|nr:hypothetical protein [Mordavella massiliensis]